MKQPDSQTALLVVIFCLLVTPTFAQIRDADTEKWKPFHAGDCCVGDSQGGKCWKPRSDGYCYANDEQFSERYAGKMMADYCFQNMACLNAVIKKYGYDK